MIDMIYFLIFQFQLWKIWIQWPHKLFNKKSYLKLRLLLIFSQIFEISIIHNHLQTWRVLVASKIMLWKWCHNGHFGVRIYNYLLHNKSIFLLILPKLFFTTSRKWLAYVWTKIENKYSFYVWKNTDVNQFLKKS